MFESIILITGDVEQPVLGDLLRQHNPALTIHPVVTGDDLAQLDWVLLPASRIVGFCTNVLVQPEILTTINWGAYNFHPGSPAYPGWAPAAFAFYHGESRFGATAHEMVERVDSGAIIDVEMFDIPAGVSSSLDLEELAYTASLRLFWRMAENLATRATPLQQLGISWGTSRCTHQAFAKMCEIPTDIEAPELARRVQAFGAGDRGIRPTITLHGHHFRLE